MFMVRVLCLLPMLLCLALGAGTASAQGNGNGPPENSNAGQSGGGSGGPPGNSNAGSNGGGGGPPANPGGSGNSGAGNPGQGGNGNQGGGPPGGAGGPGAPNVPSSVNLPPPVNPGVAAQSPGPPVGGASERAALEAVQSGRAVPLETILPDLEARTGGQMIDARLVSLRGFLLYEIKVLTPGGRVDVRYYYAQSGLPVRGQ